jgi:cell division transport system permease protein
MNDLKKPAQSLQQKFQGWWQTHLRCLMASLGQILLSPVSTILTVAVIGIALALPTGLLMALNNIAHLTGAVYTTNTISLYLEKDIDENQISQLQKKLESDARIQEVTFISSAQALDEYRQTIGKDTGQVDLIDLLGDNPLPASFLLIPKKNQSPDELDSLSKKLKKLSQVEQIQFDSNWSRRLHSILQLLNKFAIVLGILLITSVLLIIGNTIRVGIQNRIQEIQLSRLFGATNTFIRRPFLYSGLLYGFFGGIFASLLLLISYSMLHEPFQQLISNYQQVSPPETGSFLKYCLLTIFGGAFLGVVSSWIAVFLYQKDLEKSDIT